MSDEDLELRITLDDPEEEEEDVHSHLQFENSANENGPYPVVFGEGDWTCTVSRLTVTTDDPMQGPNGNVIPPSKRKFEIGVCIVACLKHGQIVEQKVFYDLAGIQKQVGVR